MFPIHQLLALTFIASGSLHAAEFLEAGTLRFDNPRHFAVTRSGNFAKSSFQTEITVNLKGGGGDGCAFFGLGSGTPDTGNFNEPSTKPSLAFRFAPSDFAGGLVTATVNSEPCGEQIALGDGTHRLRMTWDTAGRRAWLDLHPNWTGGATFTSSKSMFLPGADIDFANTGHLFAGGSGGVSFSGFQVRKLSAAEVAKLPTYDIFIKDPTARTWLPVAGTSAYRNGNDPTTHKTDAFLKSLNANLRPLVCWYSGSALHASRTLPNENLELPGSRWKVSVDAKPVDGQPEAEDLTLSFTLLEGTAPAAGVAAAFDFQAWSADHHVLIPASVYNGNRNRIVGRGYNSGLDRKDLYDKALEITHGSVPCLARETGKPSKLEVNTSNVATPAICVYNSKTKRGFIVLSEQAGRDATGDFIRKDNGEIMDNAFCVEESPDRSQATLVVSAPGVRERKPEFIGFSGSPDRGMTMHAGRTVTLKLRLLSFEAADMPEFFAKFMSGRKALTGPNHPRNLFPASKVETLMASRIDSRFHKGRDYSLYCPENAPWISYGWIGGMMNTFPMLVMGDNERLGRVTQTFDLGLRGQGESGYFFGCVGADGKPFGREGYDDLPELVLTRKNGDVLYWMIKQFELLRAQGRGEAIEPVWEASTRELADAFVTTWTKNGQWGNHLNVKTGEVAVYNSTGGISAVGGLALASKYYHRPEYLTTAKAAADLYYRRDFLGRGFTFGACADIMQNADSETASGLVASLMVLYEITGEAKWLEMAHNAAPLVASWTTSFDYELPKSTELGSLGAKLCGAVWASTQNKHGAPGLCTNSGDYLFKLYRSTGDALCAELLRDIIRAHAEGIRPSGEITERLTYCDADSRGSRGGGSTGWNELNGILMAQEIPGVYLRTDMDRLYVFDAVEAKVTKRDPNGVMLEITNPTPHDAKVSIFFEDAAQAAVPQGSTAFLKWPKVPVSKGSTATIHIAPDGSIHFR